MRYLASLVCVLALGVMPMVGCTDNGGDGGSGGVAPTPGTLLSAEEIDPFGPSMKAWRVLYASQAIDGSPIEVSGIVAAPSEPPADGSRDVVEYAHHTVGLFDACAPSSTGLPPWLDVLTPTLINAGYVMVATDYEGLGTPGIHPYKVGESEARGVLDIVRAARQIDEAHASDRAVVWGLSQGGHAALFAGEIAADWAPEIEVLGLIAAAPSSELETVCREGPATPDRRGFIWMLTVAFEATYPGLSLEDLYDAQTLGTIAALVDQEACRDPFLREARDVENAGFVTNPADLPAWRERLVENSPGYERTDIPILMLQGSDDRLVPQSETDMLFNRLCNIGSETDYRVFEGYNHVQSLTQNLPLALEWTAARFAGEPAADTCPE